MYARAANMFKMAKNWTGRYLVHRMIMDYSKILHVTATQVKIQ